MITLKAKLRGAPKVKSVNPAVNFAKRIAGTDKVIIFDGNYGSVNLSPALGEFLIDMAPQVSSKVEQELLPKWVKQRGIDPEELQAQNLNCEFLVIEDQLK